MKTVRRTEDRRCDRRSGRQVWHTFFDTIDDSVYTSRFGALEGLDEDVRTTGSRAVRHRHSEAELFTYVAEGVLRHEDNSGHQGTISAGEFLRRRTHRGGSHRDSNGTLDDPMRAFGLRLRAAGGPLAADLEQRRISVAERRGRFRAVGSHEPSPGAVTLQQDATIYSAVLDAGQHVVHALRPGRIAWLHVVRGAVRLDELSLLVGDGVGVTGERSVAVTAMSASEVLLVDVDDGDPDVEPATVSASSAAPVVHRRGQNGASPPASSSYGSPGVRSWTVTRAQEWKRERAWRPGADNARVGESLGVKAAHVDVLAAATEACAASTARRDT